MRPGEHEGREYFFLTEAEFKRWVSQGRFLEWAEYAGHLYGTPAHAVGANLRAGLSVILEIELKGAEQVLERCAGAVMIFIMPPSLEELERRLRGRETESERAIRRRLARAEEETQAVESRVEAGLPPLHYVIVNNTVERASAELAEVIEKTREEDGQTYCR
jgi:guanylate kinase